MFNENTKLSYSQVVSTEGSVPLCTQKFLKRAKKTQGKEKSPLHPSNKERPS